MKFRLLSDENEHEQQIEFISEGEFHFIKKPLPAIDNKNKKRPFRFFRRNEIK